MEYPGNQTVSPRKNDKKVAKYTEETLTDFIVRASLSGYLTVEFYFETG